MGWALYDGDALVLRGSGGVDCTFTVGDRARPATRAATTASAATARLSSRRGDGFATPSTVVSVFDYRCYGDGASAATDGDATAAPTPAPAAYALPADDAFAVDRAFDADLCNYEDGGGNGGPDLARAGVSGEYYLDDVGVVNRISATTLEVTVTIATVNVETGLLTYMEIVAERVKEGGIMLSDKFAIFDPRPYDGATDYFRAFLELVLVGTVLFLISMELGEMRTLAMFVKAPSGSRRRASSPGPLRRLRGPLAVGRITEAPGDADAIQDQYDHLRRASHELERYDVLIAVKMIFMAFQLIKNLDFHRASA
ncbi:hypothetical protein JL720_16153 [Aureococcus anophagefferens]|nr:hypothetical protein JL720_16153 [Aureococcus anophagefferens]